MSMSTGKQPAPGPLARAFSAHIRQVMEDGGVTRAALATAVGLSRTYISKRLRDEMSFTLNDAEDICRALGIDPPRL